MTVNEAMLIVAEKEAKKYGYIEVSKGVLDAKKDIFWGNKMLGLTSKEPIIIKTCKYILPVFEEEQEPNKSNPRILIDMYWGEPRIRISLPDDTAACLTYKNNVCNEVQAFKENGIKLTEEQKEILKGKICPYCHIPTEYKNSIDIYGIDYGMIYYCPKCQAYVGVHKGTDQAKGRLANAELRKCKIEAHRYFDKIFKRGIMKRTYAYQWLSEQLGLPPEYTHIGMFNPETCRKVVELSKQYLNTMRWALRTRTK